jgi:hypothetical protein
MYKKLPHGVKVGITRSIATSFEHYMKTIEWNEKKFDIQQFMEQWRQYIHTQSTWIHKLDDQLRDHPDFHETLAMKVNEKITDLLHEEPTEEQLHILQEYGIQDADSFCKLEAEYHIECAKEK